MDRPLARILSPALAALFVLLVALTAAHYRFPYEPAARWVVRNIEETAPVRVRFDAPAPGRPFLCRIPGLRLDLVTPDGDMRLVEGGLLTLRLKLLPLAAGRLRADFRLQQGRNTADGRFDCSLFGSKAMELSIHRIDWPEFALTDPGGRTTIRGKLDGSVRLEGRDGRFPSAGTGAIRVEGGRLSGMNLPDLPIAEFDFQRLEVEFGLTPAHVRLTRFELTGDQDGLNMTGYIQDLKKQRLDLSGSARLGPAEHPLAAVRFQVSGTLTAPRVHMTGARPVTLPE